MHGLVFDLGLFALEESCGGYGCYAAWLLVGSVDLLILCGGCCGCFLVLEAGCVGRLGLSWVLLWFVS